MATLIGVARTLPETCTFGVPVFADGLGRKVAQRIDDTGTVTNFELMETPTEFRPIESKIDVVPGDSALFAFEIASETFLLGTGPELAEVLRHEAPTATALRDATRRAVQRFVDSMLSMPPTGAAPVLVRCAPSGASIASAGIQRRRLAVWSTAAAALLLLSIVSFETIKPRLEQPQGPVFISVNEPMTELLSDGSVVSLGLGTKLRLEFTAERRIVHLGKGEARFNVAKDKARPFTVSTSLVDATAVGTVFTVVVDRGVVVVEVHEGIVELSVRGRLAHGAPITVKPGQKYIIPRIERGDPRQIDGLR